VQRREGGDEAAIALDRGAVRGAVLAGRGVADDREQEALQQAVVGGVLGDAGDDLGLDAAEQAGRPVRHRERAALHPVDGEAPAVEEPEVRAAIAAAAPALPVAVEVGDPLG
jgi:hypothetical protein